MKPQEKLERRLAQQGGATVLEIGIIVTMIALVILAVVFIIIKPRSSSTNPPSAGNQPGAATSSPTTSQANAESDALKELLDSFVALPGGEFMMGSATGNPDEKPAHRVRLSPFEMGKYEVTQAQWQAVMGDTPSYFKGANRPVEQVSWHDAQQFIERLNGREDGYLYRLPTEAEWEYACRAGSRGDYAGKLDQVAWYDDNSESMTHPVGSLQPNAWGLYDLHGNVYEWCQDVYDKDYYAQSPSADPQGPASGTFRVKRGGGYGFPAAFLRSSVRDLYAPTYRFNFLGLRLVRTRR